MLIHITFQTALDYAEPNQRALLVEGIRPVLPLIRNTPYGKRIQNKLQREHLDHFGGYQNQQMVNHTLSNQGMGHPHGGGARHIPQAMHQANPLADVYATPNGVYPIQNQASFGQAQMAAASQLHALQAQSIDGYVLQNNSSHNQGMSAAHSHGGGFSGATFANVNHFGGAAGVSGMADPYQRSFGYGM
jgi:hypothetical protein